MSTFTIDPSNIKLICGDYTPSNSFAELIVDDGNYNIDDQLITINSGGVIIDIRYDVEIEGRIIYEKGDYYTPYFIDTVVDSTIVITSVEVDEYEVDLTNELNSFFSKIVKQLI